MKTLKAFGIAALSGAATGIAATVSNPSLSLKIIAVGVFVLGMGSLSLPLITASPRLNLSKQKEAKFAKGCFLGLVALIGFAAAGVGTASTMGVSNIKDQMRSVFSPK